MNIKELILGRPLKNDELAHEKMTRLWGLHIGRHFALLSAAALHNQTAHFFSQHLSKHKNIATVVLPFHYLLDDKHFKK